MGKKKLSELAIFPGTPTPASDLYVGVHNNGDGTYTDYMYPIASSTGINKKIITIGTGGATLTDVFFSNTITEIVMNNQSYIVGDDFTQSGTTITGVTISFVSGQKLIAKI